MCQNLRTNSFWGKKNLFTEDYVLKINYERLTQDFFALIYLKGTRKENIMNKSKLHASPKSVLKIC